MDNATWRDLDADSPFKATCDEIASGAARNFAVCFDFHRARCKTNLTSEDVDAILKDNSVRAAKRCTRWLSFSGGQSDTKAIMTIAKQYGLSSRLTALLCCAQAPPASSASRQADEASARSRKAQAAYSGTRFSTETSIHAMETIPRDRTGLPEVRGFADVVEQLWHFCSFDKGQDYVYVGFNALFTVPGIELPVLWDRSKPFGLRVWTSLLLCNDGTIISVFEKPSPSTPHAYLQLMRYNPLNVFRHLSQLNVSTSADALMQIDIRPTCDDDDDDSGMEPAAMVFYYLFDDWLTTFNLITMRHNPYRTHLEDIRSKMFETAATDLVRSLDLLGRQLTALKLMYQSYDLIICRLLKEYDTDLQWTGMTEELEDNAVLGASSIQRKFCANSDDNQISPRVIRSRTRRAGLTISQSAILRFERLLDRIRLHALTEIEECLKQKESLVLMNFNLIALKESHAVEKLTRTTVLLAKVTILFLPVSLMTSYFSVQLPEVDRYNLKTYWLCFLVVILVSIVGLSCFGAMTEKVGGSMTYKSFTRTLADNVSRRRPRQM